MHSCGLSLCGKRLGELGEAAALLLRCPATSPASLGLVSRASLRTLRLAPAVPSGHPAPRLPLLPVRQTLGQRRGLRLSLCPRGDHALERGVACLTTSAGAEWPALASLGCPPLPGSAAEPPVSFRGCHCPLQPLSGPEFLWLVARPLAAGESWTSGRKDAEAPAALQVLPLYRVWAGPW